MSYFYYTDHHPANSSAIADLYYNENDLTLIIVTHNGTLVGYKDVDRYIFDGMIIEDRSDNGSLGRFWNTYVKGYYPGLNTSDIGDLIQVGHNKAGVDTGSEHTPDLREFVVDFNRDGGNDFGEAASIFAHSILEALDKFNEITVIAGWQNVEVTGVTRS